MDLRTCRYNRVDPCIMIIHIVTVFLGSKDTHRPYDGPDRSTAPLS